MSANRICFLLAASLAVSTSGCGLTQCFTDYVAFRQQLRDQERLACAAERQAKLQQRQAEIQALEQSRIVYAAKQQAAKDQFDADRESAAQALRASRKESIKSDIGLELNQDFELGQLQVDAQALKDVLARYDEQQKAWEEYEQAVIDEREEDNKQALMAGAQQALNDGDFARARECLVRYRACDACDCAVPGAGPQAINDRNPVQPLRAVDIPFMVPVRMRTRLDGLSVDRTRVVRQPVIDQPLRDGPCDDACDYDCTPYAPPCPPYQPYGRIDQTPNGESGMETEEVRTASATVLSDNENTGSGARRRELQAREIEQLIQSIEREAERAPADSRPSE